MPTSITTNARWTDIPEAGNPYLWVTLNTDQGSTLTSQQKSSMRKVQDKINTTLENQPRENVIRDLSDITNVLGDTFPITQDDTVFTMGRVGAK